MGSTLASQIEMESDRESDEKKKKKLWCHKCRRKMPTEGSKCRLPRKKGVHFFSRSRAGSQMTGMLGALVCAGDFSRGPQGNKTL